MSIVLEMRDKNNGFSTSNAARHARDTRLSKVPRRVARGMITVHVVGTVGLYFQKSFNFFSTVNDRLTDYYLFNKNKIGI